MTAPAGHQEAATADPFRHAKTLPAYLVTTDRLVREGPDLPHSRVVRASHSPGRTEVTLEDGARLRLPANAPVRFV